MKMYIYMFCVMFFALPSIGAEFDLGRYGIISFTVPDGWICKGRAANKPDGTSVGYVIGIKPNTNINAKCLVALEYITEGEPNKEVVRNKVLSISEEFASKSVEKKKILKDFSLEKGYGAYCLFTDASLVGKKEKPGDYKIMAAGLVQPSDNMLGLVTLGADEINGEELKAMIRFINSLRVNSIAAK